jgi:predicted HAD superfamily Cof-like phosphohydrolase
VNKLSGQYEKHNPASVIFGHPITPVMQTLDETLDKVKEFHDVFGLEYHTSPSVAVSERLVALRHRLMQEENDEYLEAAMNGNLELIADALGDKLYILCGTILAHGLQDKIVDVFNEIHRSNMSKLDENGKPIYREDGKILKSKNYFLPAIKEILEK